MKKEGPEGGVDRDCTVQHRLCEERLSTGRRPRSPPKFDSNDLAGR